MEQDFKRPFWVVRTGSGADFACLGGEYEEKTLVFLFTREDVARKELTSEAGVVHELPGPPELEGFLQGVLSTGIQYAAICEGKNDDTLHPIAHLLQSIKD